MWSNERDKLNVLSTNRNFKILTEILVALRTNRTLHCTAHGPFFFLLLRECIL